MSNELIIGYGVTALTALVGLFTALYKPINENTKQMTELIVKMGKLTEELQKQNKDFEEYKKHVSKSQQRQWDEINTHGKSIVDLKHDLEMCRQENGKESKHDV